MVLSTGSMRFLPTKTRPVVKNYQKIRLHLDSFFDDTLNNKYPEILNSGEITDSLMQENGEAPFSIFIASIFENQRQHNVLFLTKSNNIGNLLKTGSDKIVPSFTINACLVAKKWEKGLQRLRESL